MQGSLNAPSIVIRSSRTYSALMLVIAAVFVAIGAFMLRDPKESATISYLVMIFFGAGIPLFAWQLIRPSVLTLGPDGVTWRSPFRTVHYQWDDLQNFRACKPTSKTISKHLGFDFTDCYHIKARRTVRPRQGDGRRRRLARCGMGAQRRRACRASP
jgi:Bacterial PH domain